MSLPVRQEIVISGLGGQGVLFITRILAQAAILKGYPVFTSETHGMAQRGGAVISHLKVGDFASPLIRPSHADGLITLTPETFAMHSNFLKEKAWAVVNGQKKQNDKVLTEAKAKTCFFTQADVLAQKIENARSTNLVLLGYSLQCLSDRFFCDIDDAKQAVDIILSSRLKMQNTALKAINAGYDASIKENKI